MPSVSFFGQNVNANELHFQWSTSQCEIANGLPCVVVCVVVVGAVMQYPCKRLYLPCKARKGCGGTWVRVHG